MKNLINLGTIDNKWLPIIDKLISSGKDPINILEKLEIGDSNKIKVAKLLTNNKKVLYYDN